MFLQVLILKRSELDEMMQKRFRVKVTVEEEADLLKCRKSL
jgi:hypothetical protein